MAPFFLFSDSLSSVPRQLELTVLEIITACASGSAIRQACSGLLSGKLLEILHLMKGLKESLFNGRL